MLGRQFNGANIEYGFNGKWNEVETGYQNYGMRDYSERARRFNSVDPITAEYPMLTPYQFASNNPIVGIDQDGLELIPRFKQNSPFSLTTWSIATKYRNSTLDKASYGAMKGVAGSVTGTVNFVRRDMWHASTWQNVGEFFEEVALGTSTVKVANTPMLNAATDNFINNVIYGDAYTRSKFIAGFATDILIGELAGEGIGKVNQVVKANMAKRFFIKAAQNVEEHLSRAIFLNEAGTVSAENQVMIDRIRKIARGELTMTDVDKNFIDHELTEAQLMKKNPDYEKAHQKALEIHGIKYEKGYEKKLYTKEALDAGDAELTKEKTGNMKK